MISDKYQRSFKKLRVSLTHECNFACIYCAEGIGKAATSESKIATKPLPANDLIKIIEKLHSVLNLTSIRLTGGEPLLHPKVEKIVAAIHDMGITNIGMTTNGHMLFRKIEALKKAGLTSVNISLDAISDETFKLMSRNTGLNNVLQSVTTAIKHGIDIKLNTVVVAGSNEHEIIPLLEFAMQKGIIIRFLELMPMGPLHHNIEKLFFSENEILKNIESKYSITKMLHENNATSNYWAINGVKAFGIIANESSPFCSDCNRLRLDSYGNIYGCLSSLIPIPVVASSGTNLEQALNEVLSHKQAIRFTGNTRTMQSIGG